MSKNFVSLKNAILIGALRSLIIKLASPAYANCLSVNESRYFGINRKGSSIKH